MPAYHVRLRLRSGFGRDDDARRGYLDRLGALAPRADWRVLSYCLLDDAIYLGLERGGRPLDALLQPLHARPCGVGLAPRYDVVIGDADAFAGHAVCLHHNAPVRRGLVRCAWGHAWSSHAAYVALAPRPVWLDARRGLSLCGLRDDADGRRRFDELVFRRSAVAERCCLSPELVGPVAAGTRSLRRAPPTPLPARDTRPDSTPAPAREPVPMFVEPERALRLPFSAGGA